MYSNVLQILSKLKNLHFCIETNRATSPKVFSLGKFVVK